MPRASIMGQCVWALAKPGITVRPRPSTLGARIARQDLRAGPDRGDAPPSMAIAAS